MRQGFQVQKFVEETLLLMSLIFEHAAIGIRQTSYTNFVTIWGFTSWFIPATGQGLVSDNTSAALFENVSTRIDLFYKYSFYIAMFIFSQ